VGSGVNDHGGSSIVVIPEANGHLFSVNVLHQMADQFTMVLLHGDTKIYHPTG
jgi:hypothetical protein